MNNEKLIIPNLITLIISALFGFSAIAAFSQEITNSQVVSFETSTFYDINEESVSYRGYISDDISRTFTVPNQVDRILIKVWAAGGGGSSTNIGGGSGDFAQAEFAVTPGETININIGKAGDNGVPSTAGSKYGTNASSTTVYKGTDLLMQVAGGNAGSVTNPDTTLIQNEIADTSIITEGLVATTATGALAPNNTDKDYGIRCGNGGKGTNNGWSLVGDSGLVVIKWGFTYPIHLLQVQSTITGIVQNEHKYNLQVKITPETIYASSFTLTPVIIEGQPGGTINKETTFGNYDWVPKPAFHAWYFFNAGGGNPTPAATITINQKLPIKITPLSWNLNLAELNNIQFTVSPDTIATWQNRADGDDPQISGYIVPIAPGFVTLTVEGDNKRGEHIKRTFIVQINSFGDSGNKIFTTKAGFIPQSTYDKYIKNNSLSYSHNDVNYIIARHGGLSMTAYKISLILTQNMHNNPNPQVFDTLEYIFTVPQ